MTREPRDRGAAALDRYWDAVVDGRPPAVPSDGVGEAAAALARRLHALGDAPGEAGARARVWARVTAWCPASRCRWQPWHMARRLAGSQFSGMWSRWAVVRMTWLPVP